MANLPKAQEAAGVLVQGQNGLELTDVARRTFVNRTKEALVSGEISLPFPCLEKVPVLEFAKNIDLNDKNLYPDFHKFWVDGLYLSIAKSLNVDSNFPLMPVVFDPTAVAFKLDLKVPDVSLPQILATFPSILPLGLELIEIPPAEIPSITAKLPTLVVPGLPSIPSLDITIPNINFKPFGTIDIVTKLNIGLPLAFLDLFKKLALPDVWINFNLLNLFEISCRSITKTVIGSFENPVSDVPPATALAASSALASCVADSAVFACIASILGAGALLKSVAAERGYA